MWGRSKATDRGVITFGRWTHIRSFSPKIIIMIVSAGAAAHSITRMVPSIKGQRLAP
jgi:hypothetical protein